MLPSTRRTFLSDSIWPSTIDDYEELPADRKKFIPVELVSKDVLSHDVPEKEANMYWRDFARFVDNMDVINSVKNRSNKQHHNTPSFSTTEYFTGFQLNGGTQLFIPLQLCIPVDFNNNDAGNNIDFNLIAFCLQSSLVHQHQPTDIWSFAIDFAISVIGEAMIMIREIDFAISMTHKIDFVVLANKIISGEGSITSLASAHGERLLLHQDSSYDVEETRPPATITGIILPSVNTIATSNTADYYYADPYVAHDPPEHSFDLVNSDIFPWGMHYCLLHDVDYSNYDGGGVWKMPIMSLQSDCFSVSRRVIGPQLSYLSDVARVMHMHTHPFVYVTPYKEETSSYCDGGVENEDWETYCFNSSSNLSYISALRPEYVHHHYRPCLISHGNEIVNGNERSDLSPVSPYQWTIGEIQCGGLRTICEISGADVDSPGLVDEKFTCDDMCVTQLQPITINFRRCATSDLPRCSFSFNFLMADGPYWSKAQSYDANSQTSRISNMYWARFIACNIFCCHQASELSAIFFDIEAWGEILCCLFCEDGRSHYMSRVRLVTDGQFADNPEENMNATVPPRARFAENLIASTRSASPVLDVKYTDVKSDDGSVTQLLVPSAVRQFDINYSSSNILNAHRDDFPMEDNAYKERRW